MKDVVDALRSANAGEAKLDLYTRLRAMEVIAIDRTDTREERFQNTAFWRKILELSELASINLAQGALRTIVLLNGGGLVAIPPLVNLLGLNIRLYFWWAFATGICFVVGLMCGWAATFAGYLSLARRAQAAKLYLDAARATVVEKYHANRTEFLPTPASTEAQGEGRAKLRAFHRYRILALVLCGVSFVMFNVGIMIGLGMVLLGAASLPAMPTG